MVIVAPASITFRPPAADVTLRHRIRIGRPGINLARRDRIREPRADETIVGKVVLYPKGLRPKLRSRRDHTHVPRQDGAQTCSLLKQFLTTLDDLCSFLQAMSESGQREFHSKPWVSVVAIVEHLGVTCESVYRLIERRNLPALKIKRRWRFRFSEVDAWVFRGDPTNERNHP